MKTFTRGLVAWSVVVLLLAPLMTGCGQQNPDAGPNAGQGVRDNPAGQDHSHGGWWCVEHGIPEDRCSMCSATAAAKFKEEGDWCDEHNRAESQCFKCDPSRAEKFSKLYEAKYGQAPPKATE